MTPAEFSSYDGLGLAALVKAGDVTALEIATAAVTAAQYVNPHLNFIAYEMFDTARAAASSIDMQAPFAGVPFLLKDLIADFKGAPLSNGSRLLAGFVSDHDSTLVSRFKRAGLNVIAKSTSAELGASLTTETALFGATRNPWDVRLSSGGSTGGSAAAVAAGVVPMAHANDGIGSIRVPAAVCGLFGLKPTRARTPCGPQLSEIGGGRAIEFALSRSVRDSAALLDAVQGPEDGAPYWAPPAQPYLAQCSTPPQSLRIGLVDETFSGAKINAEQAEAARDTARLCESLGHYVSQVHLPLDFNAYVQAMRVEGGSGLATAIEDIAAMSGRSPSPDTLDWATWQAYQDALSYTARDYLRARDVFAAIQRGLGTFFANIDVLITPVLTRLTAPIGWFDTPRDDFDAYWAKFAGEEYAPFCGIFNVTGQPAASLPLYQGRDGLPIGTQLVCRFGEDATLIALSAQLEAARPWKDRVPPVHAGAHAIEPF